MKPIGAAIVERTWKRLGGMSPEEAPAVIDAMGEEQPFVLAYLMAVGEELLTKDELGVLLHIGIVVWQAMTQGDEPLRMVSGEHLEAAEAKNFEMLEYLGEEREASFYRAAERMREGYNQREILKYILEALMEEPEEGPIIGDENIGVMFIHLKTVLDAMDS
jgi:hypothetical protein